MIYVLIALAVAAAVTILIVVWACCVVAGRADRRRLVKKAFEGETLYFHEDGMILEVVVVENTSDHEWTRFKLRQTRVVNAGPFKQSPDGTEFDVCSRVGSCYGGMWTLRSEPNGSSVVAPYVGRA